MDEPTPRPRLRASIGAVVVLLLVGLGCAVLVAVLGDRGGAAEVPPPQPTGSAVAAPSGGALFVHVLGAVAKPGLYELHEGARAVDAVAAAGGFLPTADQAALNLARFVSDGEQLVVPEAGAAPAAGAPAGDGRVNLNIADAAALDTLPGVGPALAERILAWRDTNGRFSAVEDLLQIAGIGDKTFAELKDLVTV